MKLNELMDALEENADLDLVDLKDAIEKIRAAKTKKAFMEAVESASSACELLTEALGAVDDE